MSREEWPLTIRFEAISLDSALVEENDRFYVASATGRSHYLTLQRSPPGSTDDDGRVYVEVDDQGFGGYDHVSLCEVSPNGIRIGLGRPLGSRSQVIGIEVSFARGVCPSPEFVEHLRVIFTGQEARLRVLDDDNPRT